MTETQNASGWHRIDEATPKNVYLALGWWDVRRGHEQEWVWVKGCWVASQTIECEVDGDDDGIDFVEWFGDEHCYLKPGWYDDYEEWGERQLRPIYPTHYRDISDVPPLAGADAGAANSMIAGVPGPVASGQPEGPSKEREK